MSIEPALLRRETRAPIVLGLLRSLLKAAAKLPDPVVRGFWLRSVAYTFQRDETEVERLHAMVAQARDTEDTLRKARAGCIVTVTQESLAYVIRVAYGQVVFTPRHDAFTQSTYLQRLHFGGRKQLPFPEGGPSYQVHGPGNDYLAPLPQAYALHAAEFAKTQKESVRLIYREMLDA